MQATWGFSSGAFVWYALVGLPLFQFLSFRVLYRWGIWCRTLLGLSRTELELEPSHPDLAGGLSCTTEPVAGFARFTGFDD